jgi:hypothetical protein
MTFLSDLGTRHSSGLWFVRDELVEVSLYAGTPKERFVKVRVAELSGDPARVKAAIAAVKERTTEDSQRLSIAEDG